MHAARSAARVLISTAPDQETADRLAGMLVGSGLAACVNLLPGTGSVYVWEGQVQRDSEILMVVKTTAGRAEEVIGLIELEHPYECPEAIVLDVAGGSHDYLEWIAATVG
jgi:periplasmic divalent cation tolerance protein